MPDGAPSGAVFLFSRIVRYKCSSWEQMQHAPVCVRTQWAIKLLSAYSTPPASANHSFLFHIPLCLNDGGEV